MDTLLAWLAHYGYAALFTLLVLGIVGLPVPDESLLLFAGYLVFTHELALAPTLAAAGLGSLCGITLSYGLGRLLGRSVVQGLGRWVRVEPAHLARVQAWYVRGGKYLLLVGYYIPGVRHLTAYVAGASQLPLPVFALFAYTGGLLWASSFVTLGYLLGEEWTRAAGAVHAFLVISVLHRLLVMGAGVVGIALALLVVWVWRRPRAPGAWTRKGVRPTQRDASHAP